MRDVYYGPRKRVGWRMRLRAIGRWRSVHERGIWSYQINSVTQERRAIRVVSGIGAVEADWLCGGEWRRSGRSR